MKSAKIAQIIARLRRVNLVLMVVVLVITTPFCLFSSGIVLYRTIVFLLVSSSYFVVLELVGWCWETVFRDKAEMDGDLDP